MHARARCRLPARRRRRVPDPRPRGHGRRRHGPDRRLDRDLLLRHRDVRELGRPRPLARRPRLDSGEHRQAARRHHDDDARGPARGVLRHPGHARGARPRPRLGPLRLPQQPLHRRDPDRPRVDVLRIRPQVRDPHLAIPERTPTPSPLGSSGRCRSTAATATRRRCRATRRTASTAATCRPPI